MNEIGIDLKELREQLNMTQSELASELGVTREFINLVEKGKRNLSESLSIKIGELIKEIPNDLSGWDKYRQGKNFAKIIEVLREQGHTLTELKSAFNKKGSDLSYMYIGFRPVTEDIKTILEDKYEVDLNYLIQGKKIPMFKYSNKLEIEKPYYNCISFDECIEQYESGIVKDIKYIKILNYDVDAFFNMSGDNLYPTFKGNEIIGVKKQEITDSLYGRVFLIKIQRDKLQLGRVFPSTKKDSIIIRKEQEGMPELIIKKQEITNSYLVSMVIKPDFI